MYFCHVVDRFVDHNDLADLLEFARCDASVDLVEFCLEAVRKRDKRKSEGEYLDAVNDCWQCKVVRVRGWRVFVQVLGLAVSIKLVKWREK